MQNTVLMSIKPHFAEAIFAGRKHFEFRRALFRRTGVTRVIVYASSPRQKVVGEFSVGEILACSPDSLWNRTCRRAGISKTFFDSYFQGRARGFAITVEKPTRYDVPLDLQRDLGIDRPPQSFRYLPSTTKLPRRTVC